MIHGILNVYKEKGYTSHDVVAKLRGITGQKKIGHTGTLDPDAVGVLPVCLGKATRLCDLLTDKDKTYETVLLLGQSTDTQDISGQILETNETKELNEEMVSAAIRSFVGEYEQIPPMYSALKVGGKKLYELAREGKVVERKSRKVKIHEIEILEIQIPRVKMRVSCSKGTYIRTLCHDIGEKLGCGGCMEELTRTRVSRFEIGESLTLDEIAGKKQEGRLMDIVTPIDSMFLQYRKLTVRKSWDFLAKNGNSLTCNAVYEENGKAPQPECDGECIRVYDEQGHFIGLYNWQEEKKEYRIVKMFFCEE
ncbi:tRNA pseudouridine(55) synthase TruB [Dorea sp. YH-dor226]|uniref:tRNA pseudouridine(55) synthase TruB n=1 Tax=Dorea sp. YH-dor226 TaxID=3151119 RepID=UPI0032425EC6